MWTRAVPGMSHVTMARVVQCAVLAVSMASVWRRSSVSVWQGSVALAVTWWAVPGARGVSTVRRHARVSTEAGVMPCQESATAHLATWANIALTSAALAAGVRAVKRSVIVTLDTRVIT